jgi:hypothetical protein
MGYRAHVCKALAGIVLSLALSGCVDQDSASEKAAAKPSIPTVAAIKVYLKLDPSLTRGMNMGDRWVSIPTFTTTRHPGKQLTVDARAVGLDDRGRVLDKRLAPEWLAADPNVVMVSPARGNTVKITALRPGESSLRLVHGSVSTTLTIKATYDQPNNLTQVSISQPSH